jgi:cytoskeleton protein RodZ
VNAELGPAETPPGGIGTLASAKPLETPAPSASANRFAPMPALTTPTEGPLLLRTRESSWIEVTDAAGKSLFSRNVAPGESVSLGGELPLHVKVGNAAGTDVVFRGETVDLASQSKDNVARIELK